MVQFMYTRKFLVGTTQRGETGKNGVYVLFYNWGGGAVCLQLPSFSDAFRFDAKASSFSVDHGQNIR